MRDIPERKSRQNHQDIECGTVHFRKQHGRYFTGRTGWCRLQQSCGLLYLHEPKPKEELCAIGKDNPLWSQRSGLGDFLEESNQQNPERKLVQRKDLTACLPRQRSTPPYSRFTGASSALAAIRDAPDGVGPAIEILGKKTSQFHYQQFARHYFISIRDWKFIPLERTLKGAYGLFCLRNWKNALEFFQPGPITLTLVRSKTFVTGEKAEINGEQQNRWPFSLFLPEADRLWRQTAR